ncbi:DUF6011 domain-containing protein [Kitasatospora sp. NPDC057223]|uniref:DUF6011 domain-containing protein n=1 Tax=Kitasatospora sp. NPDC057223 TaxID=3346055 RepID=UPI003641F885
MTAATHRQLPLTDDPVQGQLAVRVTCRRCKRALRDPESRLLRLGPECRGHVSHTARHNVDQDTPPGI